MARRGRPGPRGRGDRRGDGDRNGYRSGGHQGNPNHLQDRPHAKGFKSFDRDQRQGNPYKKINNLPDAGGRNRKGGNAGRPGQNQASTSQALNEMFRITVPQGQRYDKETIINKIRQAVEQNFAYYNYEKHTGNSTFFVVGRELSDNIKAMSRRVTLDNGFQLVMLATRQRIEEVQIDAEVKEVMKRAIAANYDAQTKVLSLSNFVMLEELKVAGLFLPAQKKNVLEEIVNIIVENIADVVAINLSNNRLATLDPLKAIVTSCPNVMAFDLSKNNISQRNELRTISQLPLIELNIKDNPFCDKFKNTAELNSYIQEMIPTVKKVDGDNLDQKVSFGVTDAEVLKKIEALPPPVQYCIPSHVEGFVVNFVKQYFETFDSPDQRANISAVYNNTSVLTYSYSNLPKRNDGCGRSSHNLLRLSDESLYNRYAHFGTDFIMRFFSSFPRFQHNFETFTIDVPIVEGETMMVSVNGQITEIMKNDRPKLAFSRLWMITMVDGKPIIANDQYHLTSLSQIAQEELVRRPKSMDTLTEVVVQPAVFVPPVMQQSQPMLQPMMTPTMSTMPAPAPMMTPTMPAPAPIMAQPTMPSPILAQPTMSSPAQNMAQPVLSSAASPIAGALGDDPQKILVTKFMGMTNMVQAFAEKCLMEANNDLNKAYEMFKAVFTKLPPEAFQK